MIGNRLSLIAGSDFCSTSQEVTSSSEWASRRQDSAVHELCLYQGKGKPFSLPGDGLTFGGVQGFKDCSLLESVNISREEKSNFFHGKFRPAGDNIFKKKNPALCSLQEKYF